MDKPDIYGVLYGPRDAVLEFKGQWSFLSNFYASPIPALPLWRDLPGTTGGEDAPTVEHAYHAAKAVNQKDRQRVLNATSAGDAKKIGRSIECRPDWDQDRLSVMRALLKLKFFRGGMLAKQLLATPLLLVEGNNWRDAYWGCCENAGGLVGLNHLGWHLMELRHELGGEDSPADMKRGGLIAVPPGWQTRA
jgi:ribA/ribD-fused uncharacterized protein